MAYHKPHITGSAPRHTRSPPIALIATLWQTWYNPVAQQASQTCTLAFLLQASGSNHNPYLMQHKPHGTNYCKKRISYPTSITGGYPHDQDCS